MSFWATPWRARDRRQDRDDYYEVQRITDGFIRACEGAGLVRTVDTVTGPTVIPPKLTHITLGPPTVLVAQLQPGQTVEDVRAAAPRLAPHLGAVGLRVEPRGVGDWVVLTLLQADPLADTVPLPSGPITGPLLLGWDENGRETTTTDPLPHLCAAGSTGSGKSSFAYSLLAQVAERAKAGEPVKISGVDPSGVLLRPFLEWQPTGPPRGSVSSGHLPGVVLGLSDPAAIERKMTELVGEMDRRIKAIPRDRDRLPVSPAHPWHLVVLEEFPGLLKALEAIDKKAATSVRASVSRLLAESRKAGFSVFLLAQRPEAQIIGGAERAQLGLRLSFRLDGLESVKLLHPEVDPALAAQHCTAAPGVAILSATGRPAQRIRTPWIEYGEYIERVSA
ncbi:hypothetical protein AD006_12390 [Pseudonocardia sp. EC080610-09]|uniref:FtsK/SpoIIIE domain-containing protein n=1 Tax=unclassified Pseudonocardia TaxID=2619320 RepID=UPI0006CB4067|nr:MULTISPECIES: FtsK/SpoIIIE domain-containing protein [unclassified Pseudonocardia]ALE72592.1 hypothetical protein FRP1_04750 [Pseudonocardia sp. EC080625-04]ALL75905.1 hypothetical protein AD006_12390 [Pseudonocardia sp. EC080610-09]ALL82932.1 hypothetical protein AD017_20220 [Pseudonocardia sp. EC080619-01]